MNSVVTLDWRFVAALGAVACGIIVCAKMSPEAIERVSIKAIDACREIAVAGNSNQ